MQHGNNNAGTGVVVAVDAPSFYTIPNEQGYFPAGSTDAAALLAKIDNVALLQTYPETEDPLLATGTLILHDPDAGTADDVAIVGRCGDTLFYVMADDATTKASEFEFVLMLPKNCIVIDMTKCADKTHALRVEGLLAARTRFHDESIAVATVGAGGTSKQNSALVAVAAAAAEPGGVLVEKTTNFSSSSSSSSALVYPENLPDDSISRSMFWASRHASRMIVRAGELGASKIDSYGEKKKEEITESKDVKVGRNSMMLAKATRSVSEKTYSVTEKVSGKISDFLGGKLGRAVAIKDHDSARMKKARSLLLASTLAYAEIGNGASEGYEMMVKSAQSQATAYVAKKYGHSAAELCRHTAGAATNFGRAALTARRIVDVKKVMKSAGKTMVKEGIKSSLK